MDYLFFDIECANCNGGYGKICSFGYVLTDDAFCVKKQEDLLVNPKSEFGWKFRYAYPKSAFFSAPDFPAVYPVIRELLTAKERMCFAFSAVNDIRFLLSECDRYQLECPEIFFYDVQTVYGRVCGADQQTALEKARESLGLPEPVCAHRSDEDADVTRRVLAELCVRSGLSPAEMAQAYPECAGRMHDFTADVCERTAVLPDPSERTAANPACKRYLRQLQNFLQRRIRPALSPEFPLFGREVCASKDLEEGDFDEMQRLIVRICEAGGEYVFQPRGCDIFLDSGKENDPRRKIIDQAKRYGSRVKSYDFQGFLKRLRLSEEEFERTEIPVLGPVCPAKFRFERYAESHGYDGGKASGTIADLLRK